MTRSMKQWARDTSGLRANAQRKALATEQRAEAALALLIQEQRPITFKAVAQTAHELRNERLTSSKPA